MSKTMRAEELENIHRLAHRHWMKHNAELGISFSEFEYLSAIFEQAELSKNQNFHGQHLHDLVTAMGVNKASASAMMEKFEKRKLIQIKPCKKDARAKHFVLTARGEKLRIAGKAAYASLASQLPATPTNEGTAANAGAAQLTEPNKVPPKVAKPRKQKPAPEAPIEKQSSQLTLFG